MKNTRILLFILFLLAGPGLFAQVVYEPGYIITNNGTRTNVLIKINKWDKNPESFTYKASEDAADQTATIDNIQEFGVASHTIYRRFDVDVDQSNRNIKQAGDQRKAKLKNERLFLKLLVGGGAATLYEYHDGSFYKFFFQVENKPVEQLIFKPYRVSEMRIAYNYRFRQQLMTALTCDAIAPRVFEDLNYSTKALTSIFTKYNICKDPSYTNVIADKVRNQTVHIHLRPMITYSKLDLISKSDGTAREFSGKTSFGVGLLVEYSLPFDQNKWSVVFEPAFRILQKEFEHEQETVTVDYDVIGASLGVRRYISFGTDRKLFINAAYGISEGTKSEIVFDNGRYDYSYGMDKPKAFISAGGGMLYKKFSGEVQYIFDHNILDDYYSYDAKYNVISIIFGYRML